jgi:hypothetical protein
MTPKIKIDRNVPVPDRKERTKGITETLRLMKEGESTVINTFDVNSWRACGRAIGIKCRVERDVKRPSKTRLWRI